MNPVNWYVRAFTPRDADFLDDEHPTEKMVLMFGFYGVLVALYSFIKWQGEAVGSLVATSTAMLLLVLVASALLKARAPTVWAVNTALAAFTLHAVNMVIQTGGIESPHTYWLITNIVLVYFLADRRTAFIWALLNTCVVLALIAWQQSGTPLPAHDLTERTRAIDQWSGYLLPVLVVWLAQSINLNTRTAAQTASQNALSQARAHASETAQHAEKLSRVLDEAGHSMQQMHAGGRHLGQLQQDVQTHGEAVQQQSEQLADASTFFDQQLNTVSASLDESTLLVQSMQQDVSRASSTSDRSGEALEAVVQNMDKIKSNNDQIDRATRLINDIAEQTNLLALNAAIESARAGEAGRGFAVVADEVRSLSQRSDASANEIRQLLTQSTSDIDTGVSVVNTAHATLADTLAAVNTVAGSIVELSERIEEQNRDLAEMARSSNDLAAISQRQKEAASALTASQQALGEQASTLTDLSERMQTAMQA